MLNLKGARDLKLEGWDRPAGLMLHGRRRMFLFNSLVGNGLCIHSSEYQTSRFVIFRHKLGLGNLIIL